MHRSDARKMISGALASLVIAATLVPAATSADPLANTLILLGDVPENVLTIVQTGSANRATMEIERPATLVAANSWYGDLPLLAGLTPGRISQQGTANDLLFTATGAGNLFASSQSGFGNRIEATIRGTTNQAAVFQVGTGNSAVVNQVGSGNSVAISQHTW